MSPEILDWWSDKFAVATAILTLTAAGCGVFAYLFTSWSSTAKDERIAKANKEAAEAKLALGMVSLESGSRTIKLSQSKMSEELKSMPPGVARIFYKPEDEEAYQFASQICWLLSVNKWEIDIPRPIPSDMQMPAAIPMPPLSKESEARLNAYLSTLPTISRIGAGPLTFEFSTLDEKKLKGAPGYLLLQAFIHNGFPSSSIPDMALPKNEVRIIVGQNIPSTLSFPSDK